MDTLVFLAVMGAAVLHALWNALVKGGADKYVAMAAVVLGHAPLALIILTFVPLPDPASWPYIVCGAALHVGYQVLLLSSYRVGDLTQVYPIARGTAPLIVAGVSVLLLGVHLTPTELVAILIIGLGIISLSAVRRGDGTTNGRAALFAVATGCFIAGYSLVDGLGARLAGTSMGFYAWLSLGNVVAFAVLLRVFRPGTLRRIPKEASKLFVIGGGASFAAYTIVIWAFTQAPIALVTGLRETSIVFVLLIGVVFLKEKLDLAKVFSTFVTLAGAILLRISR